MIELNSQVHNSFHNYKLQAEIRIRVYIVLGFNEGMYVRIPILYPTARFYNHMKMKGTWRSSGGGGSVLTQGQESDVVDPEAYPR